MDFLVNLVASVKHGFGYRLRNLSAPLWSACPVILLLLGGLSASAALAMAETCPPQFSDPRLQSDDAIDVNATNDYRTAVAQELVTENFGNLDCLADRVRSNKARFAGGMWRLHTLYEGLESPLTHPTEKDWADHLGRIQRWVQSNPQSITARIALAESYVSYAWAARGEGASDSVSENGWELFADRGREARTILEEASKLNAKCPEWYAAMMSVAIVEGWKPQQARQLFERSFSAEPEYYYVYREYAMYLLPKWYGEEGQTEAFAREIADRVGAGRGDAIYFQIASFLTCNCVDQPQLKHMSWARIQNGFAQLDKQYGTSLTNLNYLAHMAVKLDDPAVADRMLKRIGDQWSEATWHTRNYFDESKRWSSQLGPVLERQRSVEAEAEMNRKSAEGAAYQSAFDKTVASYVQKCVASVPAVEGSFELLVQVGEGGTIKQLMTYPSTPMSQCLFQGLLRAQKDSSLLPPPPKAPYWVQLNLNPASSSPALAAQAPSSN